MELASTYLQDKRTIDNLINNQVRFTHFGRKDRIPSGVRKAIEYLETKTMDFDKFHLNLALDYGGLDELARGMRQVVEWIQKGKLTEQELIANPAIILGALDSRSAQSRFSYKNRSVRGRNSSHQWIYAPTNNIFWLEIYS